MKTNNKIIITAGGTSERIDNVRKITNSSSGKLGVTIANKILERASKKVEKIYFICAKNALKPNPNLKLEIIEVFDTAELKKTVETLLEKEEINYFIHAMAVSDYTVDFVTTAERLAKHIKENQGQDIKELICTNEDNLTENKISSYEDNLIIKLKRTPKIISLIKTISPKTYLVGFKLLDGVTESKLIQVATKLRDKNNCDLVVANDLSNIRNGHHKACIIKKNNEIIKATDKEDIANKLVSEMFIND